jgi:hypothetical protein
MGSQLELDTTDHGQLICVVTVTVVVVPVAGIAISVPGESVYVHTPA